MKIFINLLPLETIAEEARRSKFYKIQFIGVAVILVLIFLTSLTLALQILQNRNIKEVEAKMIGSEEKISSLKTAEASLFILKNRLNVIGQYFGVSSKQSSIYRIINKLTPPSVSINTISVDRNGTVSLLAYASASADLDEFMNNLVNKNENENLISEVALENLNRGKDGFYRISLKIK